MTTYGPTNDPCDLRWHGVSDDGAGCRPEEDT